jgi:hypothetical protein
MSLQEGIDNPLPFHASPTSRKIAIVCGLIFCLLVGWMSVDKEFDIYGGAPNHAVISAGQTIEVRLMRGSVRYVTEQQRESLKFWEDEMGSLAGLAFLAAFLLLLYGPKRH